MISEIIFWINAIPIGILTVMVTLYFVRKYDKEVENC